MNELIQLSGILYLISNLLLVILCYCQPGFIEQAIDNAKANEGTGLIILVIALPGFIIPGLVSERED